MIDAGSIDYAHARLWARNGERPDESAWRNLEIVRDFSALIDTARRHRAFRGWVARIAPDASVHDVEAVLRAAWRERVDEVARWMPRAWQPALRWCAALADVPVVQYLARGGSRLAWIDRDPRYRDIASEDAATRAQAFRAGPLAPLLLGFNRPDDLVYVWREEWRRRLPTGHVHDSTPLAALERALTAHARKLGGASIGDGAALRRELHAKLLALFRRALLDPAAPFIFVGLCALDLERLRGELLRRVAFPRLPLAA